MPPLLQNKSLRRMNQMGIGRRVFEFLKMASIAHAKWDYETVMWGLLQKKVKD